VVREDISKVTTENKTLNEISNELRVKVVNFATSKNLSYKSTMFPHHNIHNLHGHLLMEGHTTRWNIF
jgi:hypothetical protein